MKFARYTIVQVLAYGLDIGGFLILFMFFGIGPISANIAGKILAGVFAFLAHRYITFKTAANKSATREFILFAALLVLNVPLSSIIFSLVLLVLSPAVFAKFIADVIGVFLNYWLINKYVFVHDQASNKECAQSSKL